MKCDKCDKVEKRKAHPTLSKAFSASKKGATTITIILYFIYYLLFFSYTIRQGSVLHKVTWLECIMKGRSCCTGKASSFVNILFSFSLVSILKG